MNKILFIVGPTATGKTSLGIKLSKIFHGEIISADSRQVYKDMDIGTGKDIPAGFKFKYSDLTYNNIKIGYYSKNKIKIWGYDLVNPHEEFSVSHFIGISWKVIKNIWKRQKLPIVVGGTGLYSKSLVNTPETSIIPPNMQIRKKLEKASVIDLQSKLINLDKRHFFKMNYSDQHNPRRLIRAIEVKLSIRAKSLTQKSNKSVNSLWIGLKLPLLEIDQKIDKRVINRVKNGFKKEVSKLLDKNLLNKKLPAASSMGYLQWKRYLNNEISKTQAIKDWQMKERQYARRQITWFKKQPNISWYKADQKSIPLVVQKVKNWYPKKV